MLKNAISTLLSLSILTSTGCSLLTAHHPQSTDYAGPKTLTKEIKQRFDYKKENIEAKLEEVQDTVYYTVETRTFETHDPHLNKKTQVTFEYYKTKTANKPPLVLVSPILGGSYPFERPMCEHLAENGISAVLVHRPRRLLKYATYPSLETMIRSITTGRRKALDAVISTGEVDASRMGSFGISMGAITNVPLMAVEPRLKYHLLGLPGGNIPKIIFNSSEDDLSDFVKEHTQQLNISKEDLLKHLNKDYHSDPLALAPHIDARNVRMFLAYFDTVVPTKYGHQLHKQMGKPELNVLPTGHYTAALYYFWIKCMSLDFYQERFGVDTDKVDDKKRELMKEYRRTHPVQRKTS